MAWSDAVVAVAHIAENDVVEGMTPPEPGVPVVPPSGNGKDS